ncbi:TPA: DUF2931 family protein [Kluyvera intermedia]|uniref:Lipoprotein n=2 Tax=Enterobacteriaceae TaxID=543 RepID=A0AAC8TM32_9ENTR|nr:DUF2931 family protein [Phytobacter ursingii]HAT2208036.1 DUF2931 family protein [Kluyvera intermedia]AKL11947.1 lipoprotein [Phytobacter ursingii]HAT2518453.1 DUF2931 family protein [Kluyvera intermedia]HAT2605172.1 DUF2931 family protein [Kluyvera intermedia]HAT2679228.1 DUF2931 family protein [Kluyvera intermedia]
MTRKTPAALILLVALSGCQARAPQTPEDTGEMPYGKWQFDFFTPHALPAFVTRALIIDSEDVVYTFNTLDRAEADPDVVGTWNNRTSSRSLRFNKARHPPAMMLFCWDSVIDKKSYETRIVFDKSIYDTMMTPTGKDRLGNTAWYKTLLIGLAPEGKVRIWLRNSAAGDNLPVQPRRLTTLSGDKLDACKGITTHSQGYGYTKTTREFIKDKTYPYGRW